MSKYRKALVAVAGVCAVIGQVASDGAISAADLGLLATAIAVAVGVERIPNAQV